MLAEENGSQLVEFIGILPLIMATVLIGWQFFLAGHTFIVTANAAREGARALAVCGANGGDAIQAVQRSVPSGYTPMVEPNDGSGSVTVKVTNQIPVIDIFANYQEYMPPVKFQAVMRKEKCR
ncbi:MAG: TadE family protein [Caldilineaceae bacterium]